MATLALRLYDAAPGALQSLFLSYYGWKIRRERFGPEFERLTSLLERSERWSRDEMRAYQDERIAALFAHAYATVPFYRERMDAAGVAPSDVRRVDDLPKLPILRRDVVVAHHERMVSSAVPGRRLWKVSTSGTTGSPVHVCWDLGVAIMNNACYWRSRRWAGFEFGRPYATLFSRFVVAARAKRPPYWRVNPSWNQLLLSAVHLSEETAPLYLEAMRDHGVEALEAYPSSAYVLARYAEAAGVVHPLRCVFTTSEPLLAQQREVIEERFRCRVFDTYSQAERVMFSSECEAHDGHHLYGEYGVTELVDDQGVPVPEGTIGRVVATSLHNFGMPLLRYELSDATALAGRTCGCGRTLTLATGVATKEQDILVAPDGRMLSASMLIMLFKDLDSVVKSQVIQERPDEVTVRVVTRGELSVTDAETIEHGLHERLGEGVRVRFERVSEIPPSARGKYRWVISKVPLRWGTTSAGNLHEERQGKGA